MTSNVSAPSRAGRASGVWGGVKSWSGRHPRLSRVVWFTSALVLLALLIWAIYPAKQNQTAAA